MVLESFAEGAEEPGDVLQMFKGGPLAPRGGAWREIGEVQLQGRDGGGITADPEARMKSEGQGRAGVGMGMR